MKLDEITKLAKQQEESILFWITIIEKTIKELPAGKDISIPIAQADEVEAYCDKQLIPCYRIAKLDGKIYFSVASSYFALLAREKQR